MMLVPVHSTDLHHFVSVVHIAILNPYGNEPKITSKIPVTLEVWDAEH